MSDTIKKIIIWWEMMDFEAMQRSPVIFCKIS